MIPCCLQHTTNNVPYPCPMAPHLSAPSAALSAAAPPSGPLPSAARRCWPQSLSWSLPAGPAPCQWCWSTCHLPSAPCCRCSCRQPWVSMPCKAWPYARAMSSMHAMATAPGHCAYLVRTRLNSAFNNPFFDMAASVLRSDRKAEWKSRGCFYTARLHACLNFTCMCWNSVGGVKCVR